MKTQVTQALSAAITTLLRPLVKILLRKGFPFDAFADIAKRVYVDVATKDFAIPGRKQSNSRVSIITGMSRKEVLRVKRLPSPDNLGAAERYNRAARVLGGWIRDRRFADPYGDPAVLRLEGKGATFPGLVKKYSGDAPARAVLDELVRVGAVERMVGRRVRLVERAYIPKGGEVDKIGILGVDAADLVSTIDHNIGAAEPPFFQRKVCYDNLPAEAIPELRMQANGRAQMLLEAMDRWMSEHDRDTNPQASGTGRVRAGVGIYYFESDQSEGEES
jgi:hypothetical protein